MSEIANLYSTSIGNVTYWMNKYDLKRRSIGEAVYIFNNPQGDSFKIVRSKFNFSLVNNEKFILGLGLGLFWGEGNKRDIHHLRLGNSDPALINAFIIFLVRIFKIKKEKLRFGLQISDDLSANKVLLYWIKAINMQRKQFYKVIVTPSRGKGTYKKKCKYGVLTLYYGNVKLCRFIHSRIRSLQSRFMPL